MLQNIKMGQPIVTSKCQKHTVWWPAIDIQSSLKHNRTVSSLPRVSHMSWPCDWSCRIVIESRHTWEHQPLASLEIMSWPREQAAFELGPSHLNPLCPNEGLAFKADLPKTDPSTPALCEGLRGMGPQRSDKSFQCMKFVLSSWLHLNITVYGCCLQPWWLNTNALVEFCRCELLK